MLHLVARLAVPQWTMHLDLHETIDADITEFTHAKGSRGILESGCLSAMGFFGPAGVFGGKRGSLGQGFEGLWGVESGRLAGESGTPPTRDQEILKGDQEILIAIWNACWEIGES